MWRMVPMRENAMLCRNRKARLCEQKLLKVKNSYFYHGNRCFRCYTHGIDITTTIRLTVSGEILLFILRIIRNSWIHSVGDARPFHVKPNGTSHCVLNSSTAKQLTEKYFMCYLDGCSNITIHASESDCILTETPSKTGFHCNPQLSSKMFSGLCILWR
jgi:hypothetical protein